MFEESIDEYKDAWRKVLEHLQSSPPPELIILHANKIEDYGWGKMSIAMDSLALAGDGKENRSGVFDAIRKNAVQARFIEGETPEEYDRRSKPGEYAVWTHNYSGIGPAETRVCECMCHIDGDLRDRLSYRCHCDTEIDPDEPIEGQTLRQLHRWDMEQERLKTDKNHKFL